MSEVTANPFQSKLYETEAGDFSVIHAKTEHSFSISEHDTPFLFLTNYSGHGVYQINKRSTTLHPGSFYFLNEGDRLSVDFDRAAYRETVILQFCDRFMKNIFQSMCRSNTDLLDSPDLLREDRIDIPTIPFALSAEIKASLIPLLTADDVIEVDKIYFLLERFSLVYQDSLEEFQQIESIRQVTKEEIYRRCFLAKEYLREHFHESPSLNQLALVAMMNKFHFLSHFKKIYGETPKRYAMRLQLKKAHALIVSGKHSITETMEKVGFASLPSFSLLFKRHFGVSPSKLLKQ